MNTHELRHQCTNDFAKKKVEVADGMRAYGNYEGMAELYRRGCFLHVEDISFARIMQERGKSVDWIAEELDSGYGCDRIYPVV